MFRNYLRVAYRNLVRQKVFSFINISGLAIGMCSSIFILFWVQDERSYDGFHKNAGNIYRLIARAGDFKAAVSPAGMAAGLKSQLPEIKDAVRISKPFSYLVNHGDQSFEETRVIHADSNFLRFFDFELLKGDMNTVLKHPDEILLTEDMEKKYFSDGNGLGKIVRLNNLQDVRVSGILKNIPSNSHIQFDFLAPMSMIAQSNWDLKTSTWGNFNFYTYLHISYDYASAKHQIKTTEKKINDIYKERVKEIEIHHSLQPLTNIHLQSDLQIDQPGNGNRQNVNILFTVAVFILLVACINYMNLATARSAKRAKEVGLRKVAGAEKKQLIAQFIGESVFVSLIAMVLAVGLIYLLMPAFNNLAGKQMSFMQSKQIWLNILTVMLVTGILSGIYPALFLSSFTPVRVLKGNILLRKGNAMFRHALVVVQFIVSIVLLTGTAVVYMQVKYIRHMSLGFDKENLIVIPITGELRGKQQSIVTELSKSPQTASFSILSELPVTLTTGTADVEWEGKDPKQQIIFPSIDVDERFFDVFGMNILYGRGFDASQRLDSFNYVINETAALVMGMSPQKAINKSLKFWDTKGTIIGVVKDFNYKSIRQSIEPLVLRLNKWGEYVVVKTKPGQTESSISLLGNIFKKLNPAYPFSFSFLDENINNIYQSEQKMGKLFNVFAVLAILISCLGLYGLSAYITEQRKKEIGVRKVIGAPVYTIITLLTRKFTLLILIAFSIAIPFSWLVVSRWLEEFVYHIEINWLYFVLPGIIALLIAWLTISYESVKAAIANPVNSLRSE